MRGGFRVLLRPIAVMAVSRLVVLGVLFAVSLVHDDDVRDYFQMWDGRWYDLIAHDGYPRNVYGHDGQPVGPFAFFPVYPLLIRSVHAITPLNWSDAASTTSFLLALLVAALLWMLVRDWRDEATADRTVALFAFFPAAFVFTLHYSEAAMLCPAIACLLLLHRRRWVLAGLAGAVCTAARPNGFVIVACCLWAAVVAVRQRREWHSLVAPAMAPAGVVIHFLYLWRHTGHASPWYVAEREGWHDELSPVAVVRRVQYLLDHQHSDRQGWLILAMSVFALVTFVLLLRDRLPGTALIWTIGILVIASGSEVGGLRPRFVMTAFPLLVPIATRLRSEMSFAMLLAVSASAQVVLVAITALGVYLIP